MTGHEGKEVCYTLVSPRSVRSYQVKTKLRVRSPRDCCTRRRPTGTLPSVAAAPLTLTYWDYLPCRLGG